MEVTGERKAPGIPPPTLNTPTEILKPLRKEKLKIAVRVVLIFFLMRNLCNPYIKKLISMLIIFVRSDLSHQVSVVPGCSKHIRRFLVIKTNRCTEFQFYWYYGSTCFGQPFCPSSGVLSRTSALVHFMQL